MSAKTCEKIMSDFFLQNEAKCCAGSQLVFCTIKNKRKHTHKDSKEFNKHKENLWGEREKVYMYKKNTK